MTGGTNQPFVLTRQDKACFKIMIERPQFPATDCVTFGAGGRRPKRTRMMFIDMARLAGDAFRLEAFIGMAFFAGKRRMFTRQWETGQIVIEQDIVFPGHSIVAAAASIPQSFGMGIVFGMAADTFNRGHFNMRRLFVAGLA